MRDSISTYTVNIEHDSLVPEATGNPVKFLKQWLSLIQLPPDTDIKLRVKGVLRFVGHFRMLFPAIVVAFILTGCGAQKAGEAMGFSNSAKESNVGNPPPPPRVAHFTVRVEGSGSLAVRTENGAIVEVFEMLKTFDLDNAGVKVIAIPKPGYATVDARGFTWVQIHEDDSGYFEGYAHEGSEFVVTFAPKRNG